MKRSIGCELSTFKDMKKQWDKHQESIIHMNSLLTSCNSPKRIQFHSKIKQHLNSLHLRNIQHKNKAISDGNKFMLARINQARSTISFKEFEIDRARQLRIIENGTKFSKSRTQVRFQFDNDQRKYRHLNQDQPLEIISSQTLQSKNKYQKKQEVNKKYTNLRKHFRLIPRHIQKTEVPAFNIKKVKQLKKTIVQRTSRGLEVAEYKIQQSSKPSDQTSSDEDFSLFTDQS